MIALGASTCGGSVHVKRPVVFTSQDSTTPSCTLSDKAPPEAFAMRDDLLRRWSDFQISRLNWLNALGSLATALGVPGADDSLIIEVVGDNLKQLALRGCSASCDKDCSVVTLECKADEEAQRRATSLASLLNAHLSSLHDATPRATTPINLNFYRLPQYAPLGCDVQMPLGLSYRDEFFWALARTMSDASRLAREHSCPGSVDVCRTQCASGDGGACANVAFDPSLSEEVKLDLRVRACESGAARDAMTEMLIRSTCASTFTLADDSHPALHDRAAGVADKVCAGPTPSERCASLVQVASWHTTWFRARPLFGQLQRSLPDRCEAMGATVCATLVGAFGSKTGSLFDAAAQTALATVLRHDCGAGSGAACASLLSEALGDVTTRPERAASLARACDLDVSNCNVAAYCFEGKCPSVSADELAARHANQRLCDDYKTKLKDPVVAATLPACKKAAP